MLSVDKFRRWRHLPVQSRCPSLVLRPPYSKALLVPPSSAGRVKQMATGRISHALTFNVFSFFKVFTF